jgi:hypothetical protein
MKTWMRFAVGAAALALAIAVGTGAYAMRGTDEAPSRQSADLPESEDAPLGGGGGVAAACIEGSTDCNDTPDIVYEDAGDSPAKCAADAADCAEPAACPDEGCTAGFAQNCVTLETDPAPAECYEFNCGVLPPGIEPGVEPDVEPIDPALVDPPADGDPPAASDLPITTEEPFILPAGEVEGGTIGAGCLGIDPCTISSRPVIGCLPPDCAVSSDGAIDCPTYLVCDEPIVVDPMPPVEGGETEIKPFPAQQICSVDCLTKDPVTGDPLLCETKPCVSGAPALGAPEGIVEECTIVDPAPGSGSGSSDGSSGGGSAPALPVPERTE